MTLLVMLACLRRLPDLSAAVQAGDWKSAWSLQDRFGSRRNTMFDDLLKASDIVSLHLPLTSDTQGFLDPAKMKKGAILINTARGGLVKGESLHQCLRSGHQGGLRNVDNVRAGLPLENRVA
jgi:phosphoglycerate dehydrogenase-like enzyme